MLLQDSIFFIKIKDCFKKQHFLYYFYVFLRLYDFLKMSETLVFPYLSFSDLRTIPIKKNEKIGGVSAKFHPNRSDFQFFVPVVFFFQIFFYVLFLIVNLFKELVEKNF